MACDPAGWLVGRWWDRGGGGLHHGAGWALRGGGWTTFGRGVCVGVYGRWCGGAGLVAMLREMEVKAVDWGLGVQL